MEDDLRAADLELVALAPHRLDQHREVKLAAPAHDELIRRFAVTHRQRDIRLGFVVQTLPQPPGCAPARLALAPGEGRGVHAERHADGRLLHADGRQALRYRRVGDGIADVKVLRPGKGDDVASVRHLDLGARQVVMREQVLDGLRYALAIRRDAHDLHALAQRAGAQPPHADLPLVVVVIQRGDQQACRLALINRRAGDLPQDSLEKRREVVRQRVRAVAGNARLPDGVHKRELRLLVVRP